MKRLISTNKRSFSKFVKPLEDFHFESNIFSKPAMTLLKMPAVSRDLIESENKTMLDELTL